LPWVAVSRPMKLAVAIKIGWDDGTDTEMMPETALTCITDPEVEAPNVFERPIEELVAPELKLSVTRATTPLGIAVEFSPAARHVCRPDPELQDSDLPAAVSDDPTCQETEETVEAG
jgi:hypothetical protein